MWLEKEPAWSVGQVCLTGIPVGHKQGKGKSGAWNSPTLGLVNGAGLNNQSGENILGQALQGNYIAGLTSIPSSPIQIQSLF